MFDRTIHSLPILIATSAFTLICFSVSLIAISKSLRGGTDRHDIAMRANILGTWMGLFALEYVHNFSGFPLQLLFMQSIYLMARRSRAPASKQEIAS